MDIKWGSTVFAVAILAIGWFFVHDWNDWTGFYYPDSGSLEAYKASDKLSSLEECRMWAKSQGTGKYECGRSCEFDFQSDIYVCEETLD